MDKKKLIIGTVVLAVVATAVYFVWIKKPKTVKPAKSVVRNTKPTLATVTKK